MASRDPLDPDFVPVPVPNEITLGLSTRPIGQSPSTRSSESRLSSSTSSSTSSSSTTLSSIMSQSTESSTLLPSNDSVATTKSGPNVGLIVGVVFGVIFILAAILFLVRFLYIRRRKAHQESGQRLAYNKARYAISAPTNFTVVESGTVGSAVGKQHMTSLASQPPLTVQPSLDDLTSVASGATGHVRKYSYDMIGNMGNVESGLKNQVQTMQQTHVSRKAVPNLGK